jgi:amino acid transporter
MQTQPALKRSLSLPLIVLYGLGTTIGAGIYALTGEVGAVAGMLAPASFLVAALLAAFTAFSFAELSSRYPKSAGEAVYVLEGFGRRRLAAAVGLLVALAGTVSAATISTAFVGYLGELIHLPPPLSLAGVVLVMGLLAAWGVRFSVGIAGIITAIELGGLLLVVWVAGPALGDLPARLGEFAPSAQGVGWGGVLGGALLAFYAFLGFEDMVNVAEEVKDVRRSLPTAILLTLAVTTLLYVVVALVAVMAVPRADLAASPAPLALVYERSSGRPPTPITLIGVLAMVNGALIQIIMASRVLYGLAHQGSLPAWVGRVHPRTHTPVLAVAASASGVLVLALWLPLGRLAAITSILTLVIFALVNLALVRVKRRVPEPAGVRRFPAWIPAAGFAVTLGFLIVEATRRAIAG